MAILQSLLVLVGKSAGKILNAIFNAIFGWAVRALFGHTSPRDQLFLSGLMGAAVAWPLLVAGVFLPKVAALLLALVPIPHWVPSWSVRLVWLTLALIVPLALGLAVAAKGPPARAQDPFREPFWMRTLRGFPVTVALAGAFVVMLVSVPVMRVAAILRRERSGTVPLVTDAAAYHQVAATTLAVLNRHKFGLRPGAPGWWVSAPMRLLGWLGGDAFRAYVPSRLEHYTSEGLQVSFYTSGVLVQGQRKKVSWAQGLIAEAVTHGDGLQTSSPAAHSLERLIHRVWAVHDEVSDDPSSRYRLLSMIDKIARRLGGLDVDFDDWQVLYRQLMQAERAVHGERQLMEERSARAQKGDDDDGDVAGADVGGERRAQKNWAASWEPDTRPDIDAGAIFAATSMAERAADVPEVTTRTAVPASASAPPLASLTAAAASVGAGEP